jgi:catechol 2,3-dioxygenase-like lactoylglutathione lyase family enzyme
VAHPDIACIAPLFIVRDLDTSLSFYRDRLGFEITFQGPAEGPYFGIVCRGNAMIMVKAVGVDPLPSSQRAAWARWDAYLNVPDPDALAAEFASRSIAFHRALENNSDGLRGFEVKDADGYVLYFGRPWPAAANTGEGTVP